jgi:hypothetical protein
MPRKTKRKIEDAPEGSFPPFQIAPIEPAIGPESSPEGAKAPDDGVMLPFDLEADLGTIAAPGSKSKKAPAEKAEPEKPLTVEERKKAAEAEKKEASRQKFLKAHPGVSSGVGVIAKGAFATGAIIAKEPLWNLTDEEERAIGDAWKPVVEIYGPEWLLKIMPVIGAVVVTGQVLAGKSAQISEKKEKEKAAKAQAQVGDMQRATTDMERARKQLEDAANAMQGNVPKAVGPKPEPKGA